MNQQFLKEVVSGLSSQPKTLPSKYFYDAIGDQLFVKIMGLPEYYLTRAEHEILKTQTSDIVDALQVDASEPFELIELGAGDGLKTKEILKYLTQHSFDFSYKPIDISQHALADLEHSLKKEIPSLQVETLQGDYFGVLSKLKSNAKKKVVLFLGSNMGNMPDERAKTFVKQLSDELSVGDKVLVGLDKIKPTDIVMPAYDDSQGITAQFNLNLLTRINKELSADFDVECFEHAPSYNEETGIARSAIRSLKTQIVYIETIDRTFHFSEGELIHTEISRKYNQSILEDILFDSELRISKVFEDRKGLFGDWVLNR